MVNVQEYIKQFNHELKILDLEGQELEGHLELSEFTELEELNCSRNELTSLDVSKCKNLKKIDCSYNLFDNLEFLIQLSNPENLTYLNIEECGVFISLEEKIRVLRSFVNLEKTEEEVVIESLIGKLEENKKQLEKEINNLKEQNSQLGEENIQLLNKIAKQEEELTKYKAILQTSQSSLKELEVKKNSLESKLREKDKEADVLQKRINKLQVEISEFQESYQQMIVKFDAEKDDGLLEELQAAKGNIERLEKELAQAEENLESNQEQILSLQKELLDKDKGIKKVQAEKQIELDSLQVEKDKLQLEFNALKNKLEGNQKELRQKKQELSETKKNLEKERLSKSIELTKELRKQEEKLKKKVGKLKDKNVKLENQLTEKEQQIIAIDDDIKSNSFRVKPELKRLIGKGGYGEVYYGEWKLQDVAVKKLYLPSNSASQNDLKEIANEISILKKLRNRHIIQYYETYFDNQELLIIMDYAENGTLNNFINDSKDKDHDWNLNSEFIRQIALGLVYIHSEGIIHRDLKSLNVLLDKHFQVKISDFGLSRVKSINSSQTRDLKGSLRWMAPELLKEKKYSEQSDIYALGMIIWEIAAKCTTPFEGTDNNLIYIRIINGEKENIPDDTPENICGIIQRCWKDNPSERIVLANLLEIVEADKSELQTISGDDKSLDTENLSKTQTGGEFHASHSLKIDFAEYNEEEKEIKEEIRVQAQVEQPPK